MASGNPPIRIPLAFSPEQRGANTNLDAKVVNCYIEPDAEGNHRCVRRPALVYNSGPYVSAGSPSYGLGIYSWQGVIYSIVSTAGVVTVYRNGTSIGTITPTNPLAPFSFQETLGSPTNLFFQQSQLPGGTGGGGYYVTSTAPSTIIHITDANYPPNTVPGIGFLDGTLYVMDTRARVWGTANLNDPSTWSALNLIQAQIEPDLGIAIAKQAIYIIAFKQWTTEVFYDAGTATGSPLAPVLNAKVPFGCFAAPTVQSMDDVLYWVASDRAGGLTVIQMVGLQPKIISIPAISRFLEANSGQAGGTSLSGWVARLKGHGVYGISTPMGTAVYDATIGEWYIWTDSVGGQLPIGGVGSCAGSGGTVYGTTNVLFQSAAGTVYAFDVTDGTNADSLAYTPNTALQTSIPTLIVTPNFDGGTKLSKVLTKLRFIVDQYSSGSLYFRYSDNDYKGWSAWIQVNLNDTNPQAVNLGTFKKRAFQLRFDSPDPMRIAALEPELLLCPV